MAAENYQFIMIFSYSNSESLIMCMYIDILCVYLTVKLDERRSIYVECVIYGRCRNQLYVVKENLIFLSRICFFVL